MLVGLSPPWTVTIHIPIMLSLLSSCFVTAVFFCVSHCMLISSRLSSVQRVATSEQYVSNWAIPSCFHPWFFFPYPTGIWGPFWLPGLDFVACQTHYIVVVIFYAQCTTMHIPPSFLWTRQWARQAWAVPYNILHPNNERSYIIQHPLIGFCVSTQLLQLL